MITLGRYRCLVGGVRLSGLVWTSDGHVYPENISLLNTKALAIQIRILEWMGRLRSI